MTRIILDSDQYFELEKVANDAYSPLTGFMTEREFNSVIESMRLPTGDIFPIPVFLDITRSDVEKIQGKSHVQLIFKGEVVGEIIPESIFTLNKKNICRNFFGSSDISHPGVARFMEQGDYFVGGPTTLIKKHETHISKYELSPAESKSVFRERNWNTIAAFHTRNVPHRAHEWLHRMALDLCDGLFIHPILGHKKHGDFSPEAIMTSYEALVAGFYPSGRLLLSALSTAGRYAGPREAVFHAIVRRNFGCTHMIIGRDHAGVGSFYGNYESQNLCLEMEVDLGIKILAFEEPHYCKRCDGIVTTKTCPHSTTAPESVTHVSGTKVRELLKNGARPEPHIMRPEIIESISQITLFT